MCHVTIPFSPGPSTVLCMIWSLLTHQRLWFETTIFFSSIMNLSSQFHVPHNLPMAISNMVLWYELGLNISILYYQFYLYLQFIQLSHIQFCYNKIAYHSDIAIKISNLVFYSIFANTDWNWSFKKGEDWGGNQSTYALTYSSSIQISII